MENQRRSQASMASRGEGFSNRDGKVGGSGAGGRRKVGGHIILVCAVVAVLVALDYWSNVGNVYRDVEVGGVALGGKTSAEAHRMLEERVARAPEEIRLTGSGAASPSGGMRWASTYV